ncbi:MAG: polyribonucleotide nucleotidyltransferase [Bacteroidia bacterium]|nr:polyribonucleotide nucleotidyltransferase [Bacteroidia bacterium]MDW8159782.1 polyribonucleotide nucleotidyltransferase [Bacteroidia bacterium]
MEYIEHSIELQEGQIFHIETGRLARQADGAVVLRVKDTMLLATVVAERNIDPDIDFLPLSVDYKENYSSTGKIPGGFFKRDGKLNEHEILISRIVDRSIRPLFPEDYHANIQVIISLISADKEVQPDALACVAASAAICVSDIPFPDPVSTVRVTYKDGKYHINPTYTEMENVLLDLMIAGTNDSIVMVEGEMNEVSESVMMEAFRFAHEYIKKLNGFQLELRKLVNKKPREYPRIPFDPELYAKLKELVGQRVASVCEEFLPKQQRSQKFEALHQEALNTFLSPTDPPERRKQINEYFEKLKSEIMRSMILDKGIRLDGRRTDEIRDIWCEVGFLPRSHGSAIFTRGETQSLTTVTLGTKLDEQTIDYATIQGSKRFMLQYNFPAFSTGEVKPLRAPGRREIGHGNLAERALKNLVPEDNEYTIRVVSEILESNGSSSMATVCAGTLALMDAGIQIKRPASGIAMGLIIEGDRYAILSDILGDEDHLGDMDFKVAGTKNGLTACQMDIKVRGLSFEILAKALEQAKKGRLYILEKMLETISEPRPELSVFAPRIVKFEIPADSIGAVIGPGGKVVQEIQRQTGATIVIEEVNGVGVVSVSSPNKDSLDAARNWIKGITAEPVIGDTYLAKVKNIREAGAFCEFLPGKDGWLHISEISHERLESIEDVIKVGDTFNVKLVGLDPKTKKFRLSKKALEPPLKNEKPNNKSKSSSPYSSGSSTSHTKNQGGNRPPSRR